MKIQASIKVTPNNYNSREENYLLVNEAIKLIKDSGLKYVIGPSETTVEGDYEKVSLLVLHIHRYFFAQGVAQFGVQINTEVNRDEHYIDEKLENVENYFRRLNQ